MTVIMCITILPMAVLVYGYINTCRHVYFNYSSELENYIKLDHTPLTQGFSFWIVGCLFFFVGCADQAETIRLPDCLGQSIYGSGNHDLQNCLTG